MISWATAVVTSPSGEAGMPISQRRPVPYEGMIPTRGSLSQTWSNAVNASKPCSLTTDSSASASRTERSKSAGSISTV